jgi:hypothetical protein
MSILLRKFSAKHPVIAGLLTGFLVCFAVIAIGHTLLWG